MQIRESVDPAGGSGFNGYVHRVTCQFVTQANFVNSG